MHFRNGKGLAPVKESIFLIRFCIVRSNINFCPLTLQKAAAEQIPA